MEAIRVARAGLVQHPSYPSARLTLGRALLDSGDPAGARVELEVALRDAPDNILASRFLGQALDALGELGPALVQLQKTLKMAPGDRQLESQIVSLQTRLRSPQSPPAPAGAQAAEGGPRSPTIRIRMPGDRGQWAGTSPLPPPLPPTAAPPSASAPPPAPPLEARVVPPVFPPAAAVAVAPTLPAAHSPGPDVAVEVAAPRFLPGAVAAEETVFEAEAQPEPVQVAWPVPPPASAPDDAATGAARPFSSSTLAELYFQQGLVQRAVEVYRQVLDEEPGNERARSRLAELESAPPPADERAARRATLERTIAGLEALLVVLQRR